MSEEEAVIEATLRRKWDTAGIALLGAGYGAVVQGSNEIHHNLIASSGLQEPIASALAQIGAGTLVGTILFTAVSVVHNLIGLKQDEKKPAVALLYHKGDFAFTGAVLAIPLVLAHEVFNFLSGQWRIEFLGSADPFSHIVWQIILAALGGGLLFRAVAKIRKWGGSLERRGLIHQVSGTEVTQRVLASPCTRRSSWRGMALAGIDRLEPSRQPQGSVILRAAFP